MYAGTALPAITMGKRQLGDMFYMLTFFFHIKQKELPPQWVAVLYQFQKLISVLIIN